MAASIKQQTNTGFNMDDITKISHIGLTKDDMAVIKSILKLTPKLREKFAVIKEELYQHAGLRIGNTPPASRPLAAARPIVATVSASWPKQRFLIIS